MMNLIRFGAKGEEKPGLLKDGRVVDLRAHFPEIPDIGEEFFTGGWLEKAARINDQIMQDGNTADMIFDIAYLMEYISQDITLQPGDIISTGTPAGVGIFRDPPITLQAGDVVECSIEKIGTIQNNCADAHQSRVS